MLTPTDIHLIVGLFSKITTPNDVDIVLGEMVYDFASKSKRDIDVTIKYKNEKGEEISFVGLQVKDHNRKLGSPEVEQLCLHFKDSKSIKKGGIISASGFTKPAINKAAHHKIDLYEFRNWDHTFKDLSHVQFCDNFYLNEISNDFIEGPHFKYTIDEILSESESAKFNEEALVLDNDGTQIPNIENLKALNKYHINQIFQNETFKLKLQAAQIDEKIPIDADFNLLKPPIVVLMGRQIHLKQCNIRGILEKHNNACKTEFKILVKLDDPEFQVGAAISIISNGSLIGFSTSNFDKSIQLITIPIADRLLKKIHQMKIK
ncbi:MAG: restriction endonuclease [Bacteroidia bacterium]